MSMRILIILIVIILLVGAFVFWGISNNIFVTKKSIQSKIAYRLHSVSEVIVGKYYLQTVNDYKEQRLTDIAALFKIGWEANVSIDFSKVKPEDIVIDKDAKVISVRVPAPEFKELSIKKLELIYEKVPFYGNDEEIRNKAIQEAKTEVEKKLQNLRSSSYNVSLVETFVRNFIKKTLGEEYSVNVTFVLNGIAKK